MRGSAVLFACATAVAGWGTIAQAQQIFVAGQGAPAVRSYSAQGVPAYNVLVVVRPVVAPSAVVGRELAEQPTYSHLIEVQIGATNTLLDPYAELRRTDRPSGFEMDENHSLIRAQRLYRGLATSGPAQVIYGSPRKAAPEVPTVQEEYIIITPTLPPIHAIVEPTTPAAPDAAPTLPEPTAAPAPAAPKAAPTPAPQKFTGQLADTGNSAAIERLVS